MGSPLRLLLAAAWCLASAPPPAHAHALVRHARGPGDGCGPNPLARLAQILTLVTGESVTAEEVTWQLQKDPLLWRETLALLQVRQYHNCVTTGEGARF